MSMTFTPAELADITATRYAVKYWNWHSDEQPTDQHLADVFSTLYSTRNNPPTPDQYPAIRHHLARFRADRAARQAGEAA